MMMQSHQESESQLQKYADLELQHILLELKNGRAQHMRHFIDQYFCYKKGYVNKRGNADWGQIAKYEYISEDARRALAANKDEKVRRDHVVPLKVIITELKKLKPITKEAIAAVLDRLVISAIITKAEDARLRGLKLNDKMPEGWKNPFDRYKAAQITYHKQQPKSTKGTT